MRVLNYFLKNKNYLILFFTVSYLVSFTVIAIIWGNFEFLYYTALMAFLIYLIIVLDKQLHLAFFILVNLSILGFLHLLGGNLYLSGIRLYDFYFIAGVIRYDNITHTYGTFIATIALYSLLSDFIAPQLKKRYLVFALVLILMAIGMGTVVELVELFAVVVFGVAEKVGGYFNNALDLMFNTIGAILATVVIYFYQKRPKFIQKINDQINKNC